MKIEVLDSGYVQPVEAWGTGLGGPSVSEIIDHRVDYEIGIIEAARQSTHGSFQGWERDAKLLRFLYEHKHATPFEFSGMILEVRAPIFVFREWHRHRTQGYNELSGRYSALPPLDYMPTVERLLTPTDGPNKQASRLDGTPPLTPELAEVVWAEMEAADEYLEKCYQRWLNMGTPKELARIKLPVARYSQMRVTANLRNWLAFLLLRMDPNAQWEIRQYANVIGQIIGQYFPQTWALFCEVKK